MNIKLRNLIPFDEKVKVHTDSLSLPYSLPFLIYQ